MESAPHDSAAPKEKTYREMGLEAARYLYDNWDSEAAFDGQFTGEFAEAFIDEIAAIQTERAQSVDRVSSKRAGRSAGQLTEQEFREILEVLQNAEDEAAEYFSVVLARSGGNRELLFVHNGNRVSAPNVLSMSGSYLTGKEDDAEAIGKFGIGLKTLQRLGPSVEVHSAPYHWSFVDGDVTRIEPAQEMPGVYDPKSAETLIRVRLKGKFAPDDLFEWFTATDSRTLLFLQNIKKFVYRELGAKPRSLERYLTETGAHEYALTVGRRQAQCREAVVSSESGQSWRQYTVELPTAKQRRQGKLAGPSVRLGIAVPATSQPGLLFTGLPTSEGVALPFDIGGPFESVVSRERIDTSSPWNEWLLVEMRKFVQALALRKLLECPRDAWPLIGLQSDVVQHQPGKWLLGKMQSFVEQMQRAISFAEIVLPDQRIRVRDLSYESLGLQSVLQPEDVEAARPGSRSLPAVCRDEGRWRGVLAEIHPRGELTADEALTLFEHAAASAKTASWFIALAAAAIDAGAGDQLFAHRSVLLSNGEHIAPCRDGDGGLLVSKVLSGTDLVTRLSLARQIHSAYSDKGKAAEAVRSFLVDRGAFSDEHSADGVLRALAGKKDEPVAVSDDDLRELAVFLAEASSTVAAALSHDLGMAVTVDGFEWVGGKRSLRQVRPAEAYLPPAMDKEGWATAAAQTEGLRWIHPRYAKLKQFGGTEIGARKLFRRVGAEIAPRLHRPNTLRWNHGDKGYDIGWHDRPELWERTRQAIFDRTGDWAEVLTDDWTSDDLLAVAKDISESKVIGERRERARALIKALERAWSRLYEDKSESLALYVVRKWYSTEHSMPTGWVARLADIAWLSDCARHPSPVAPIHTRIRSDANASVYGNDASAYAFELGPEDAESPVVRALGIGGLPRASEHLEALRALKASQRKIAWNDVAHHYVALSSMCPARPTGRAEVDDITVSRLTRSFGVEKLLWCGAWLSPGAAYRGEVLFPGEAAFVPEDEAFARLWEALGVKSPSASECVQYLKAWASAGTTPENLGEALPRTYRALSELIEHNSRVTKDLKKLPVWVGDRWTRARPVYYSDSEVFARTLSGSAVPMWAVPCALYSLGSLPEHLGLELLSPGSFAVKARGGTNSVYDEATSTAFTRATELMREFVSQLMPPLYAGISDSAWDSLAASTVELVPQLTLEGRVGTKRTSIQATAHYDQSQKAFYFEHPSQIGRRDLGGALVADAFDVELAERLQLSLAWVDAWQRAGQGEEQVFFPYRRRPGYIEGEIVPDSPPGPPVPGISGRRRVNKKADARPSSERRLVDVDTLQTVTHRPPGAPPEGELVTGPIEVVVGNPRSANTGRDGSGTSGKSAASYTPFDRETAGLRILQKALAERGVELEDTRNQPTGADCVGTDGRYYELKVHAGAATGPLQMMGSQVLQARELGDRYVLAIVENVEGGQANPRVTLIPSPLTVLKVHPLGKTEVTGYDNEVFERIELSSTNRVP